MRLQGKVAIVTGASRGIGRATAIAFAKEGAKVALVARGLEDLEAVAAEIREAGGEALPLRTDVTKEVQVIGMARRVQQTWGHINLLVNCAGVNPRKPFLQTSLQEWVATLEVNLLGAVLCCRAVLPFMIGTGGGHIINVGSGAGLVGHAEQAAYSASKAALHAFSQALAEEVWEYNVLVNVIIPGPVKTELTRPLWEGRPADRHPRFPSERWKEPEEVVPLMLFLASLPPESGPTGQIFSLMRRQP